MKPEPIQQVTDGHDIFDGMPKPLEEDQLVNLAQQILVIHANRNLRSFLETVWGHIERIDTVALYAVLSMGAEEVTAIGAWDEQGHHLLPDRALAFWEDGFAYDNLEETLEGCEGDEGRLEVFNEYLRNQAEFKNRDLPDPKDESPFFQSKTKLSSVPMEYPLVYKEAVKQQRAGDEKVVIQTTLLAALQEYIERSKVIPRKRPLSQKEMRSKVRRGDYVSGIVPVDLGDIIEHDHEWLLDHVSDLLTGSVLLMDISYEIVGYGSGTLWLYVSGDASEVIQ